ncbi:hypothetical protein WDW37_19445 [Bdellovibrionota bacterium FG-1]
MRRLPKSFFWIDQSVIRSGVWVRLSPEARLAYVALAASCDREGISIWSATKLMTLSACVAHDGWQAKLTELERESLIERVPESTPPAIRLRDFDTQTRALVVGTQATKTGITPNAPSRAPIIVHTQTTIHLGGTLTHVKSRTAD